MTPFNKVLLIFLVAFVAAYISLPKNLSLNFDVPFVNVQVQRELVRGDVSIHYGKINIEKSLDLVLGLDLAGGSRLVFEVDTSNLDDGAKADALDGVREVMERRVNTFGVSEPNIQTSSFEGIDRMIVEIPGLDDTSRAVELIGTTAQLIFAEVGLGEGEEDTSLVPTDLTGSDLKRASVAFDQTDGSPVVSIEFTNEGAEKFAEITGRNINKPLVILLDNEVVSSPIVNQKIVGGSAQISGGFTTDEAKDLSIQLNAGALPVSVNLVEERTVGATLGAESIQRSVRAGLFGLLMVLLFMVLMYGKLGLIADIGLVIFGVITLSLYKMIPVVLTLPGIAGFLLSVGMAVDSNILIFERLKEERQKREFSDALEVSFGRAWDSIRDANIATLVTAFILANPLNLSFLHTSGPVRGFAITLALGIFVGLFTGIVVTRNLLRAFVKKGNK